MKDGGCSPMRNFVHNYYIHLILLRWLNQDDGRVGQVACMRKIINLHNILFIKSEGRRPIGRLGIDGRIILKWILKKYGV
jgi:hypothetical protein